MRSDELQGALRLELPHDHETLSDIEGSLVETLAATVVHSGRHKMRTGKGAETKCLTEAFQAVRVFPWVDAREPSQYCLGLSGRARG
jgi:hypothetical protein